MMCVACFDRFLYLATGYKHVETFYKYMVDAIYLQQEMLENISGPDFAKNLAAQINSKTTMTETKKGDIYIYIY